MIEKAFKLLEKYEDEMISLRRYIHRNPELSYKEEKTALFIEEYYKNLNIDDIKTNIGGENGIIVSIKGKNRGKTIGIRADFDALPIKEETGLPYASDNGAMHACGHDAHTAYLMVVAKVLTEIKEELSGTIKIIHQPAEEVMPGGAKTIIKSGFIDDLDFIFGVHIMVDMETGKIFYNPKAAQSGNAYFCLKINGKGGHGSLPNQANDPIVAGASFVMNVQTIVSRRLSPFDMGVVTIGSFDAKGTDNIIKDSVTIEGNVRAMSYENKKIIEKNIKMMTKGLEATYGVDCILNYKDNHPPLINDTEVMKRAVKTLKNANIEELKDVVLIPPIAPSEDYTNYLKNTKGIFLFVGGMPDDGKYYPHHHPKFILNEKSMIISAKAIMSIIYSYCNNKSEKI
ncbi:MAG: amidohydrolase [Andreesenia angusta]|nr:amidohydrolase [Andreesenia angusta]